MIQTVEIFEMVKSEVPAWTPAPPLTIRAVTIPDTGIVVRQTQCFGPPHLGTSRLRPKLEGFVSDALHQLGLSGIQIRPPEFLY